MILLDDRCQNGLTGAKALVSITAKVNFTWQLILRLCIGI